MSTDIDIDKLLSDDEPEESKDLKTEEEPAVQKSAAEGADETEAEKVKALKRELRKRQEEIATLKAAKMEPKKEEAKVETEPVIDENDPGAKLWLKKIAETTEAKLKPILDANQKRAIKSFIERHPEYATGDNKSKLKECVEASQGKVEEGEILESMSRMWASQNYQELEKAASRRENLRANAQKSAIKASAVGEGVKNEDDFTEEESEKAAKLNMSVEKYRRALRMLENNSDI